MWSQKLKGRNNFEWKDNIKNGKLRDIIFGLNQDMEEWCDFWITTISFQVY